MPREVSPSVIGILLMSLWLVARMFGASIAREAQAYMEYDPEPPYDIRAALGHAAASEAS